MTLVTKGIQLWPGAQHTLFCREISFVARYAHKGGGSQKVTSDDEGEGGVRIPPKIDDVIYEQPLTAAILNSNFILICQQCWPNIILYL